MILPELIPLSQISEPFHILGMETGPQDINPNWILLSVWLCNWGTTCTTFTLSGHFTLTNAPQTTSSGHFTLTHAPLPHPQDISHFHMHHFHIIRTFHTYTWTTATSPGHLIHMHQQLLRTFHTYACTTATTLGPFTTRTCTLHNCNISRIFLKETFTTATS